jgi:hypothetical protein
MTYLAFALSLATLALLAWELHGNRKERQTLALLIKSRDVQEFVRAETALAMPRVVEPEPTPPSIPLDMADPDRVAAALEANDNKPAA